MENKNILDGVTWKYETGELAFYSWLHSYDDD